MPVEKINLSMNRGYSFEVVKAAAKSRNMNVSDFVFECVDSYIKRDSVLDEIVKGVADVTGQPEWRVIENAALIKAAHDKAEIDVYGYPVSIVPNATGTNRFEVYYDHFRRKMEGQYVKEILDRESKGVLPNESQKTLLRKHQVGIDFVTEKLLRETTAKKKLLQLVADKKITSDEYDRIPLPMFAETLSRIDDGSDEMVLEVAKNILLNVK